MLTKTRFRARTDLRRAKHLGDGTFGRVLEVKDLKRQEYFAMKVIKSVKRYIESAEIEAGILFKLKKKQGDYRSRIVKLFKTFHYKNHFFMIFELIGKDLY